MMRRTALAIGLVLAVLTTGCLGSVSPAEVPSQDVQDNEWKKTSESADDVAMGLGERVSKEYNPQSYSNAAGVTVVSANDVPILDESRFIPWALDRVEERYGITLGEQGTRSMELANMDAGVTATEYDVQGAPADAKAILFEPPCDPFVVVLGWGTTETSGSDGLIGSGGSDETYYDQAITVARHVAC